MNKLKLVNLTAMAALVLAACGTPATPEAAPTAAPEATAAPDATATQAEIIAQSLASVPRNQTLIMGWSIASPNGSHRARCLLGSSRISPSREPLRATTIRARARNSSKPSENSRKR